MEYLSWREDVAVLLSLAITAGLCIVLFLGFWLVKAVRALAQKRADLELAERQLNMYILQCARMHDGPGLRRATEQVELSREIYKNVAEEYNRCVTSPQNRLAAWLLGCRVSKREVGGGEVSR